MFKSKLTRMLTGAVMAVMVTAAIGISSVAPRADAAPSRRTHLSFSTVLTSQERHLTTVGANLDHTFGSNFLTGTTTVAGQPGTLQFVATVNYASGSGPWTGLITVTTPIGTFGITSQGQATLSATTTNTTFGGTARVIGGTGAYVAMEGGGTISGIRQTSLGGTVNWQWDLIVTGLSS